MYRTRDGKIEVLLVHPGGPFWAKKDLGAWSIPKGAPGAGEDLLVAAKREFAEETGAVATGTFVALAPAKQPGGKVVHAWAFQGDLDPAGVRSNSVTIEWPPGSGRQASFPEVDRAAWFTIEEARRRILPGQAPLLDQLHRLESER
jgi:predicted NUDIX family NTP pyrophosphohydrolase